jgi:hypothetical protein
MLMAYLLNDKLTVKGPANHWKPTALSGFHYWIVDNDCLIYIGAQGFCGYKNVSGENRNS